MITGDEPDVTPRPGAVAALSDETKYLRWVAERVRNEDFWIEVKEEILESFANLLNRELPEELWITAYSQRDGKDYLIVYEAVLERLKEYCGRIVKSK